jgi:hypothetical protein
MGLMDKVKAQATVLAQKTQETVNEGKARLDQVQAQRGADVMLRNLGALVFAERTGRGTADTQAQVDKLVTDLSAYESANGINLAVQPTGQAGSWGAGQAQGGAGAPGQPQGGGQQQGGPGAPGQPQGGGWGGGQQQAGGWGGQPQAGPDQPQAGPGQPQAGPQAGPPGQFFPREANPDSPPPDTGTTQV